MRSLSVALCTLAFGSLLIVSSAQAMIAIDRFREPLQRAAIEAARCDGALPGDYRVTVTMGDGGQHATLGRDPGVTAETRKCIRQAFSGADYPDAQHGVIHLVYPFAITPPL